MHLLQGNWQKYSFLDASVDVKGLAYETIVSNTLKQEAGQFFTPLATSSKGWWKCMNQLKIPECSTLHVVRVVLVMVLDHVRKQIAEKLYQNYR